MKTTDSIPTLPPGGIILPKKKTKKVELENAIETYLYDKAKANDFLCYKFTSPANSGVPDRILIANGKTIFIELKRPGEKPRELQKQVIAKMQARGAIVYVIDTKAKIDALFKTL